MSDGIKSGPGLSVSQIRDLFFPVGVKVTSRVSPASLIGGTWEMLEEGRTVVAAGDKYTVGGVGGEETVMLSADNLPAHNHELKDSSGNVISYKKTGGSFAGPYVGGEWCTSGEYPTASVENRTKKLPHNNMPPYISEYIWTRVA